MSEPYVPVKRQTADFQAECRSLARQIEAWRKYRGFSMRRLRKLSDVPISRLTQIKNQDRADLRFTTILRIAKALSITIPELLYQSPQDWDLPNDTQS